MLKNIRKILWMLCFTVLFCGSYCPKTIMAMPSAGSAAAMDLTILRTTKWMSSDPGCLCLNLVRIKIKEPATNQYQMNQNTKGSETASSTFMPTEKAPMESHTEEKMQSNALSRNTPNSKEKQEKSIHGTSTTELLYALVQAEAGNQGLDGCRLVADVVLNRVADPQFPNTIEDVIYAPGQFSVVHNGALSKAHGNASQNVKEAVDMELSQDRLNTSYLYFNNSDNGGIKYGDHWFK